MSQMFQTMTMALIFDTVAVIAGTVIICRWIASRAARVPAVTTFRQLPDSRGASMNTAWIRYLMVIGCVLYVLSPVDLFMDPIPCLGSVDDVLLAIATYRKFDELLKQEQANLRQSRTSDVIDVQYRATA